jgi:hypothetical protein
MKANAVIANAIKRSFFINPLWFIISTNNGSDVAGYAVPTAGKNRTDS